MRTTIRLADTLLLEAKREAARCGTTLTAIIEESLRARLARRRADGDRRKRVRLTTACAGGLRSGVELDAAAALIDVMDGVERSCRPSTSWSTRTAKTRPIIAPVELRAERSRRRRVRAPHIGPALPGSSTF